MLEWHSVKKYEYMYNLYVCDNIDYLEMANVNHVHGLVYMDEEVATGVKTTSNVDCLLF